MAKPHTWEHGVVQNAIAECRKHWGGGWMALGPDLRSALVAQRVLSVIARQDVEGDTLEQRGRRIDNLIFLATLATQWEE